MLECFKHLCDVTSPRHTDKQLLKKQLGGDLTGMKCELGVGKGKVKGDLRAVPSIGFIT